MLDFTSTSILLVKFLGMEFSDTTSELGSDVALT